MAQELCYRVHNRNTVTIRKVACCHEEKGLMDGTPEQKAEWLPKLADMFASFALTEPNSGSDAASITTSAVREGDVYRVNGTKRYITNAPRRGCSR